MTTYESAVYGELSGELAVLLMRTIGQFIKENSTNELNDVSVILTALSIFMNELEKITPYSKVTLISTLQQ